MPRNLDFIVSGDIIPYQVYSTEFDRVVHVGDVVERDQLDFVHGWMQKHQETLSKRDVDFVAAVDEMSASLSLRFQKEGVDPRETSITLLVDGSGSTRGRHATDITISTIEACIALEKLGVETTVLGYTTSSWKGGQSRKKWLDEGRPRNPGRLCDLLHVVYKRPDESVGASIDHLCALAVDEIKKENVDGEALLWAADSLSESERPHKVLLNMTDGFWPVDDSTLSVNPDALLLGHLKTVADEIEKAGEVALSAVYLDLSSRESFSLCFDEYHALKDRGHSIFPRDVLIRVNSDLGTMIRGVTQGISMGIGRSAQIEEQFRLHP
ncbi:hypothetical protein G6L37_05740 [Agrobacterium rubi]|nr:hypothetical protein [Agrobacterium rubi]NTF24861.1 hypothetical protein [Agrobacterium rubi]